MSTGERRWYRPAALGPRMLAGWLFADLLAALVVVVMGSQVTVPTSQAASATPSATTPGTPGTPTPSPAGSPSPTAAPSPTGPLGLVREPIRIELPNTTSVESIRRAIANDEQSTQLQGRRAGMVLTFGRGGTDSGVAEAQGVNAKLPTVDPALFGDTIFRDFITFGNVTNIEIYLYSR